MLDSSCAGDLQGDRKASSSCAHAAVDAGGDVLRPGALPTKAVRLPDLDGGLRSTTLCFCLRGRPTAAALREAFGRAVEKNPVVAGRLQPCPAKPGRLHSGIEISFDGPVGCHFYIRPMGASVEREVERLDAEGYARRFLWVNTVLVELLGVEAVGFALDLVGEDCPVCCATFCPGERVSVVALSMSQVLGDMWSFFQLLRCWDEELHEPGSSAPLPGASCAEPLPLSLQPPRPSWLWQVFELTQQLWSSWLRSLGPCCSSRTSDGGGSGGGSLAAAAAGGVGGGSAQGRPFEASRPPAPAAGRNEFHIVAVSVPEDALSTLRAAAVASASSSPAASLASPPPTAGEMLGAWLVVVLRARLVRLLVTARGRVADVPSTFFGQASYFAQYATPESGGGGAAAGVVAALRQAADLRRGGDRREVVLAGGPLGHDEHASVEPWCEAQYVPRFGCFEEPYLTFQLHHLWQRLPRHSLLRCAPHRYLSCHFVWRRDQATALSGGWRVLGAKAACLISEADLLDALKS